MTEALATLGLRGPMPATFLSEVSTRVPRARVVSGCGGRSETSQTARVPGPASQPRSSDMGVYSSHASGSFSTASSSWPNATSS